MRVELSANPSQPAEARSKSAEPDNVSGTFFAEIDRVLNRREKEEIREKEKWRKQNADAPENGDLGMDFGAPLYPMQVVNPGNRLNDSHSVSTPKASDFDANADADHPATSVDSSQASTDSAADSSKKPIAQPQSSGRSEVSQKTPESNQERAKTGTPGRAKENILENTKSASGIFKSANSDSPSQGTGLSGEPDATFVSDSLDIENTAMAENTDKPKAEVEASLNGKSNGIAPDTGGFEISIQGSQKETPFSVFRRSSSDTGSGLNSFAPIAAFEDKPSVITEKAISADMASEKIAQGNQANGNPIQPGIGNLESTSKNSTQGEPILPGFLKADSSNEINSNLNTNKNIRQSSVHLASAAPQGTMTMEEMLLRSAAGEKSGSIQQNENNKQFIAKESMAFPLDSSSVSNSVKVEDSGMPAKDNALVEVINKLESLGQTTSGGMNLGGSHSDGGASHNEFAELFAPQSKAQSLASENKISLPIAENQDGAAPAMSPGLERTAGTNSPTASSESTASSRPGELVYQLAERIQMMVRDGKGEIRIQLKPENLGSLEIRAESTNNGVIARIIADSNSVKNYLENHLPQLQQNLQDQGLKIDRIHVIVQDMSDPNSSSGHSAQFGHAGSGGQERQAHKLVQPMGPVLDTPADEIAVDPTTIIAAGSAGRFHTVA
jgi:flagellar hook-length control protein FliK